jgi:hypothetical protein
MEEKIVLPPKYYHTNFEYLLTFVKEKYHHLLNTSEWSFLRKYYTLPEDAQCLFIRFTNRKGLFFKSDNLKYEELQDIPLQLKTLLKAGFLSKPDPLEHLHLTKDLLDVLTKAELLKFFSLNSMKSEKKEVIVSYLLAEFDYSELIIIINEATEIVKMNFEMEVSFLRFLFFGNRAMDMTEFVLRDMGLVQYYQQQDDDLVARFETRKDADDKWMVSDQFLIFDELSKSAETQEVLEWYMTLFDTIKDLSPIAKPSFDKLALRVARFFERAKQPGYAIEVYKTTPIAPARERLTRCLAKLGNIEEAKTWCELMIEQPQNNDEQYFAEYFIGNLGTKKSKKQTTTWLQNSKEIEISKIYKNQVELGAIDYFFENEFEAAFSENYPWRSIFGLWLWDIIFDPTLVSFHHPFQRRPSDLYLPDFYEKRHEQVEAKLLEFSDSDELLEYLWLNFTKHLDTANPFVVWLEEIWTLVRIIVIRIDLESLRSIVRKMAENLVENSRGFPDLLVWSESHYELVEIKGPNDNLSHQQLFWLRYFEEIGVKASVLRVKYQKDE